MPRTHGQHGDSLSCREVLVTEAFLRHSRQRSHELLVPSSGRYHARCEVLGWLGAAVVPMHVCSCKAVRTSMLGIGPARHRAEKSPKPDFRTLFGLFWDSGAHSFGTLGVPPPGTPSGLFSDSFGVPGPKSPGGPVPGGAAPNSMRQSAVSIG